MSNNLIVNDQYIIEKGKKFGTELARLDEYACEYIKILKKLSDGGNVQGETADALKWFIQIVSEIAGPLDRIGSEINRQMNLYISNIDQADEYLF